MVRESAANLGSAHFSLKALSIRSTSTSRWNAEASRERSCSKSTSAGVFDDEPFEDILDVRQSTRDTRSRARLHS